MERLKQCVDDMILGRSLHSEIDTYNFLCQVNENVQIFERIIPNLYKLLKDGKLQKDMLYLSFIAINSKQALEKFLAYDKTSIILENLSAQYVYEYCIFKERHWLTEILNRLDSLGKQQFSTEIFQKLLVLKLFDVTNVELTDTEMVRRILFEVLEINDDLLNFCINEIRNSVDAAEFVKSITSDIPINVHELIHCTVRHSVLKTISQYTDLKRTEIWEHISKKIKQSNEDLETFKAFTIIISILRNLHILQTLETTESSFQEAEIQLLAIHNRKLQLKIIKTIFTLMFLRKEHLHNSSKNEGFINGIKEIFTILHFLKSVFEIIKLKTPFQKNSDEFKVFVELDKYLIDAVWRYELVTNIKSSKSSTSLNCQLVPYMLACPKSLLYMCLKNGDFNRAMQVIQVSFFKASLKRVLIFFEHIPHNCSVRKLFFLHRHDKLPQGCSKETALLRLFFDEVYKIYI